MDRYLTVGVNKYPRNQLAGCVRDAEDMAAMLEQAGYRGSTLLDGAATGDAIREALTRLMADSRRGDRVVVHYSGHGTNVPDLNGDEPDGRDEAICPVDVFTKGPVLDDELKAIYATRALGSRLVVLSDSCYSGTIARLLDEGTATGKALPAQGMPVPLVRTAPSRRALVAPVVLSGCDEHEVSYDGADDDGRPGGAFTLALLRAYRAFPTATWAQLHAAVRTALPSSRYPQSPTFEGTAWQRRWRVTR